VPANLPREIVEPVKDKVPVPATRFVIMVDVNVSVFEIVVLILIGIKVTISVLTHAVVAPNVLLSVDSCVTLVGVVEKVVTESEVIVFILTDIL
jgi:hypothetical protein